MITVPREVLETLAALPDTQPCKLILNFDGKGGVTIETFERKEVRKSTVSLILSEVLKMSEPY